MEKTEAAEHYTSTRYEPEQDTFNSILLRLDPSPVLEQIRRFLLRETSRGESIKGQAIYTRPVGTVPIFKEEGVEDLMGELSSLISIDTALSYLEENDIRRIVRECGEKMYEFIWFNYSEYMIQEKDWNRIYFTIIHKIEVFLRRAKGGATNDSIAAGLKHQEIVSKRQDLKHDDIQTNKSGFSRYFGGR